MLPDEVTWRDGALLATLLLTYWSVDQVLRREAGHRLLSRFWRPPAWLPLAGQLVAAAGVAWFWVWSDLPSGDLLRGGALLLAGLMTWKTVTEDIDVAAGGALWKGRGLLLVATAGVAWSPIFLVPALYAYTTLFRAWRHHATLPLRLLQALVAFGVTAAAFGAAGWPPPDAGALLFFALLIQVSHYLITAFAKGLLGPHWYSWILDNRLHHLAASAYSWGWARFVPARAHRRFVRLLKTAERPLQAGAFGLEALVPLALLDPDLAVVFLVGLMVFQVFVFASSGILFWDWMVVNGGLVAAITLAPEAALAKVFGPHALVLGLALMFALPFRGKLWKPIPLGWWDTPLTQRVHWRVRGVSGRWYGLYNDFMCPHERLYGRIHGAFLVKTPLLTYHLGEVWKRELRDGIRAAQGDLTQLEPLRRRFGIVAYDAAMAAQHRTYLQTLFARLNAGARKSVLPRWLRWLKAPGGQFYYWGDLPAYRRQEPVSEVRMVYREELFDGQRFHVVQQREVDRVVVAAGAVPDATEVAEETLEAHLLRRANGTLVDVPEWVLSDRAGKESPSPSVGAETEAEAPRAAPEAAHPEEERTWQAGAGPSATGAP